MKLNSFRLALGLVFLGHLLVSGTHATAAGPAVTQAKSEAETKGYIFLTSHDEIVARAKSEGKLKVFSGLDGQRTLKDLGVQFRKKYPFITSFQAEERGSGGASQRFLMEIKAGLAKEWDATTVSTDLYSEYPPYIKKFDILGMAKHGVLDIQAQVIDPVTRGVVAITSEMQVVAYNKKLLAPDKVPTRWEDFLKPEFQRQKILRGYPAFDSFGSRTYLGAGKSRGFRPQDSGSGTGLGARKRWNHAYHCRR